MDKRTLDTRDPDSVLDGTTKRTSGVVAQYIFVTSTTRAQDNVTLLLERQSDWFPEKFDEAWVIMHTSPDTRNYTYGEDFDKMAVKRLHFLLGILAYGIEIPVQFRNIDICAFDLADRNERRTLLAQARQDDDLVDIPLRCSAKVYAFQPASVVGQVTSCSISYM